ncbi:hypothetical protein M404DRAFT_140945 [Pisolithus tinctorius Marx 270]|uniref:Uncharacterized protein n=1 Tax=Pisolithus tinctorius Marx 270 TaxID=870435 RepID=A0A0C3PCZ9_PISTI|nr:hypothetical protein M404DRAFT_140945 [Pisolithus tinctorius Marx 270]
MDFSEAPGIPGTEAMEDATEVRSNDKVEDLDEPEIHLIECLMKEWSSPVYAFFDPKPCIIEKDGWHAHDFKCSMCSCRATVHQYLDTKDKHSTGNMHKHIKLCWGEEALSAADKVTTVDKVCKMIVKNILRDGSITALFERSGKGKVTYSHRQHTWAETWYIQLPSTISCKAKIVCWVMESLQPFNVVNDRGFRSLMKTGCPEYYIPLPFTVSCDVRLIFA